MRNQSVEYLSKESLQTIKDEEIEMIRTNGSFSGIKEYVLSDGLKHSLLVSRNIISFSDTGR